MPHDDSPSTKRPETKRADEVEFSELMHLARRGDRQALNWICERLRSQLVPLSRGQFQKQMLAKAGESDLVQEVLLCVSQSFMSFRGETPQAFFAWASRILENKSLEIQRRYLGVGKRELAREVRIASDSTSCLGINAIAQGVETLESLVSKEELSQVRQNIANLPEHYREVVQLRIGRDLTFPQISAKLGWTEDRVRKIYNRAMLALSRLLQQNTLRSDDA